MERKGRKMLTKPKTTAGRIPAILGYGAIMSVTSAVFEYTGGRIQGAGRNPDVDEFERKEMLRKRYRRPVEETIAEIGEGRCESYFSLHL